MGPRSTRFLLGLSLVCGTLSFARPAFAQSSDSDTATLKAIHADGIKHLTEPQVVALSGLSAGSTVGKQDLQSGADRLLQTGLFSNVKYTFQSKDEGALPDVQTCGGPKNSSLL